MTAARLRTAAAKLREVAEGATPGPWLATPSGVLRVPYGSPPVSVVLARAADGPDATYIATMCPPVALAMAVTLEALAQRVDDICDATPTQAFGERVAEQSLTSYPEALAVADAVLADQDVAV